MFCHSCFCSKLLFISGSNESETAELDCKPPGSEVMERYLQQDLDEYFLKILSMLPLQRSLDASKLHLSESVLLTLNVIFDTEKRSFEITARLWLLRYYFSFFLLPITFGFQQYS